MSDESLRIDKPPDELWITDRFASTYNGEACGGNRAVELRRHDPETSKIRPDRRDENISCFDPPLGSRRRIVPVQLLDGIMINSGPSLYGSKINVSKHPAPIRFRDS